MHKEGDSGISSRPSVNHHEGDSEKRLQPDRCYRPRIAQERAAHRWRCRHLPRRFKDDVRKKVDEMILMDYSPEQIVGVCRKQGIKMVSHETIYQYIWWDKAHGGTVQASASSWQAAQEARSPEKEKGYNPEQD